MYRERVRDFGPSTTHQPATYRQGGTTKNDTAHGEQLRVWSSLMTNSPVTLSQTVMRKSIPRKEQSEWQKNEI